MTVFIVPTPTRATPFAEQRTTLDGREYVLSFSWNQRESRWYLALSDAEGVPIVSAKAVVNTPMFRRVIDPRMPPGLLGFLAENNLPSGIDDLGKLAVLYYYDEVERTLGNTSPLPTAPPTNGRIDLEFLIDDDGNILTDEDDNPLYLG